MEGFIRGFSSQIRGRDRGHRSNGDDDDDDNDNDSSHYKCTGRITNVGQKILAIAMSPDGRMCAYGGECNANMRGTGETTDKILGSERPEIRTASAAGRLLEVPQYFNIVDGAVTQIAWFDHNSLAIGTSFGYLHLWGIAVDVRFTFDSLEETYTSYLPCGRLKFSIHISASESVGEPKSQPLLRDEEEVSGGL